MPYSISLRPAYRQSVLDTVTSTIVERMQMVARPEAFCFIRYIMPDTEMKLFG